MCTKQIVFSILPTMKNWVKTIVDLLLNNKNLVLIKNMKINPRYLTKTCRILLPGKNMPEP